MSSLRRTLVVFLSLVPLALLGMRVLPVALTYTYLVLDLPDPSTGNGVLNFLGRTNTDWLLARGERLAWLISPPPDRTLQVIDCPPGSFDREPTELRQGPDVSDLNEARALIGSDRGVQGLFVFVRTADGQCEFFKPPGAVNAVGAGLDELGGLVGWRQNPITPAAPGLTRFQGFARDAAGTITLLTGFSAADVVWPVDTATDGTTLDILAYVYRDVQPDNSYTYAMAWFRNGLGRVLVDPNGDNTYCPKLNSVGQAICVTANGERTAGGQPWLYTYATDTWEPIPLPDNGLVLDPTALNDLGQFAAIAITQIPDCTVTPATRCQEVHHVLATPTGNSPGKPRKTHHRPRKDRTHLPHWREVREAPPGWEKHWQAAITDDGDVVLVNGDGEVVGEGRGN